jgi:hypothetical protein
MGANEKIILRSTTVRSKKFSRAVHKAGLHEYKTVQSGQKLKTKVQSTSLTGARKKIPI